MTTTGRAEKLKTRRDKIAGYFLDMSKLSFAGMVIGGFTPLFSGQTAWNIIFVVLGTLFTITFAIIGNKTLL